MKDLLHILECKAIYVLLQKQVLNAKQIVIFVTKKKTNSYIYGL